ncbi:MAG: phosphate/phosphite/phosphonate ABC transporter substrate-binding protein [Acidimicrobiia bacterium]
MSPLQFTVSPDFGPDAIAGWFIFNTWLQHAIAEPVHLELYDSFAAQRAAIDARTVDLVYANPYDASLLVRSHGFVPIVRPRGRSDEAVLVVADRSAIETVEELQPGCRIAGTDDPDVRTIGMIMLEPADLDATNTVDVDADTYVLVAKALLSGRADVGIFLAVAYEKLSALVRSQLRPLVTSQISVIHHAMLAGPALAGRRAELLSLLTTMGNDPKGAGVLDALGITAWDEMTDEQVEFMIDLMDTLVA